MMIVYREFVSEATVMLLSHSCHDWKKFIGVIMQKV